MFQSPQWGSNSKEKEKEVYEKCLSFSPRNGEVILKECAGHMQHRLPSFQSPQWGSNSKAGVTWTVHHGSESFSPRNGEVILKLGVDPEQKDLFCFSPRNGEVILKWSTVCAFKSC